MVKILKTGFWAVDGVKVVDVTEGEEVDFGGAENVRLVEAGWAEWPAKKVVEPVEDEQPRRGRK